MSYLLLILLVGYSIFRTLPHFSEKPLTCPYCRQIMMHEQKVIACGKCKTIQHYECWKEMYRCAVFGCSSQAFDDAQIKNPQKYWWDVA